MSRLTQILTVMVLLLMISACATVPQRVATSPVPDPVAGERDLETMSILATAWRFLGAENFDEALRTIAPLTTTHARGVASTPDPDVAEARRIEAHIHHVRGELQLEADAWEQSLFHDQQSEQTLMAWIVFSSLHSLLGEFAPVRDTGLALLATDRLDPAVRVEVAFVTAQALANLGDHDGARELAAGLGFADTWSVIGPFNGVAGSGYTRPFGPEQDLATDRIYADDWGTRHQWRRIADVPLAWVDLSDQYQETEDRVFYALTSATMGEATPAILSLGLSGGVKVWLNGELALANEEPRCLYHGLYETEVSLRAGANTILVKICGGGDYEAGISLRLTDRAGDPLPVRWSPEAVGVAVAAAPDGDGPAPAWPPYLRARDHYLEVGDLDAALMLAFLADYGDVEREFLREFPGLDDRFGHPTPLLDALADCHLAIGDDEAAESLYRLMDQLNPSTLGGFGFRLARMMGEGAEDEAYAEMQAAWRENPDALAFASLTVQAAMMLGNRLDLENLLAAWERAAPDDPRLIMARVSEGGTITEPRARIAYLLDKWQTQQENEDLIGALTDAYLTALDLEGVTTFLAALAERHPGNPYLTFFVGCLAGMAGDMETCRAWANRAMELAPDEPEFKQMLGGLHRDRGEFAEASRLFTEVLRDQPDNWELREALWAMAPDSDEPQGFLDESTEELVTADRQDPTFRDSPSYLLLDDSQRIILSDLASRVTRRMVGRVNDERGVKERTQQVLPLPSQCFHFEVEQLVTIKPDGRRVRGEVSENGVSFADLEPGDYFELVYTCYVSSATFMGREVWQAHLLVGSSPRRLTRYQLLRPEDLELVYSPPAAAVARQEPVGDGWVRMVWSLEDAPALVREAGLTTAALSPYLLDFTSVESWAAVGSWYERQTYRQCKPDDRIVAFAEQLVAGAANDYEKALAIARFVTARIAYSDPQFQLAMVTPGNADATLERGIGDCKDQCALLLALARAVGIDGSLALMHTSFGRDYLLLPGIRFNHVVARLDVDGESIWIDPTTGFHDPSTLAPHLQGAEVLLLDGSESRLLRLPVEAADRSQIVIHTELDLEADGRADQRTRVTGKGGHALWILAASAGLSRYERNQFIEARYAGVAGEMDVVSVTMPDTDVLRPEAEFAFAADRQVHLMPLGANTGLQAPFQTAIEDLEMPSLNGRHSALDMAAARGVMTEQVVVELPPSLTVVSLPGDVVLEIPEATYRFSVRVEDGALVFARELTVTVLEIPADHCAAFAEFLNQASRAERSLVVLSEDEGSPDENGIAATSH